MKKKTKIEIEIVKTNKRANAINLLLCGCDEVVSILLHFLDDVGILSSYMSMWFCCCCNFVVFCSPIWRNHFETIFFLKISYCLCPIFEWYKWKVWRTFYFIVRNTLRASSEITKAVKTWVNHVYILYMLWSVRYFLHIILSAYSNIP